MLVCAIDKPKHMQYLSLARGLRQRPVYANQSFLISIVVFPLMPVALHLPNIRTDSYANRVGWQHHGIKLQPQTESYFPLSMPASLGQ